MAKESFYFPHDYHARHDRKLQNLFMDHGLEAIGAYWCIIEMLYEEGGKLPCEYGRIAMALRTDKDRIADIIINYELFENDENEFWSNSVLKRIENRKEKSDKAKFSAEKRWNNANALRPECDRNAIKERKGKEIKECIGAFAPPTQDEIKNYCNERKNKVDPIKFHDFYTSKGWMVGKNKMKNWQAAVRNWEKSPSYEQTKPTTQDPNKRYEETQRYLKSLEVAA